MIYHKPAWGDEIVIIKSVSSSKKSFVISKGKKHGINKGQTSLFSTENVSLAAKVVEVTRYHSLWKLLDKNAEIPLKREQFVIYNNSIDNIYSEIPFLKTKLKLNIYQPKSYWIAKILFIQGLSETTSEISQNLETRRQGFHLEGLFNRELSKAISFNIGIRYDSETVATDNPPLNIPSTRIIGLGDLVYSFNPVQWLNYSLYMGVGLGYGQSESVVNKNASKGPVTVLPIVKFGVENIKSQQLRFLFELVVESLTSEEIFDDGRSQTTNILNGKLGVGIKF